jgi:hypothetical protein
MGNYERLDELYHRKKLKELKYEYCYTLDEADLEGFLALFTEDGKLIRDTESRETIELQGHSEIQSFIEPLIQQGPDTLHLPLAPVLDINVTAATGKWKYIAVFLSSGTMTEIGQGVYHEKYRLVDQEWKIESVIVDRNLTIKEF